MGGILFEAIKIQIVDNFISAMFPTQQKPSWLPLVHSCKWETQVDFTPHGRLYTICDKILHCIILYWLLRQGFEFLLKSMQDYNFPRSSLTAIFNIIIKFLIKCVNAFRTSVNSSAFSAHD